MIIKVQGEASAQALFDLFNGQGVSWCQPTKKGDSWHVIRLRISPEKHLETRRFIEDCFPNMPLGFKQP